MPEPLDKETIERFIKMYASAGKNAIEGAGFDGVEVRPCECSEGSSTALISSTRSQ